MKFVVNFRARGVSDKVDEDFNNVHIVTDLAD